MKQTATNCPKLKQVFVWGCILLEQLRPLQGTHKEYIIFLDICVFRRCQSLPALCVCVAAACRGVLREGPTCLEKGRRQRRKPLNIVIMEACVVRMSFSYSHNFFTICTIEVHYLHYWNTQFALFTLLKYTICNIYTSEIHYLHDLHYWFTILTLSSHLICTIRTI